MSGVGLSPALATCETSQVLLAGMPAVFSLCCPVFAPPTDWLVSYELNLGADPGFFKRGFKCRKGGFVSLFSLKISLNSP